jgi:hypothetical protein
LHLVGDLFELKATTMFDGILLCNLLQRVSASIKTIFMQCKILRKGHSLEYFISPRTILKICHFIEYFTRSVDRCS